MGRLAAVLNGGRGREGGGGGGKREGGGGERREGGGERREGGGERREGGGERREGGGERRGKKGGRRGKEGRRRGKERGTVKTTMQEIMSEISVRDLKVNSKKVKHMNLNSFTGGETNLTASSRDIPQWPVPAGSTHQWLSVEYPW